MRKILITLSLLVLCSAQQVFADDFSDALYGSDQSCKTIAKKCIAAGYKQRESGDKKFWFDCMKPILLGKAVSDVTIDTTTVKTCLNNKIEQLKQELQEMQKAAGQ